MTYLHFSILVIEWKIDQIRKAISKNGAPRVSNTYIQPLRSEMGTRSAEEKMKGTGRGRCCGEKG